MTEPAVLLAQGLSVRRGRRRLVDGVDMTIARGDVVYLAGANGVGKTTLLRILCGLSGPRAGSVHRNGRCAFVPEKVGLAPMITPAEWLTSMRRLRGLKVVDWTRCIRESGLDPAVMASPSNSLSKGMLQRIALLEAMESMGDLLVLDEPFSGLDRLGRAWLATRIADRAQHGAAVVLTDHSAVGIGLLQLSCSYEIVDGRWHVQAQTSNNGSSARIQITVRWVDHDDVVCEAVLPEDFIDDHLRHLLDSGAHVLEVRR